MTWLKSQRKCSKGSKTTDGCNAEIAARETRRLRQPRFQLREHLETPKGKGAGPTTPHQATRLPAALGPRPGRQLWCLCFTINLGPLASPVQIPQIARQLQVHVYTCSCVKLYDPAPRAAHWMAPPGCLVKQKGVRCLGATCGPTEVRRRSR